MSNPHKARANALISQNKTLLGGIKSSRKNWVKAKTAHNEAELYLSRVTEGLIIEISREIDDEALTDPTTGRKEPAWAQLVINQLLVDRSEYIAAHEKKVEAEAVLMRAEIDASDAADALASNRSVMRLESVLLAKESEDA